MKTLTIIAALFFICIGFTPLVHKDIKVEKTPQPKKEKKSDACIANFEIDNNSSTITINSITLTIYDNVQFETYTVGVNVLPGNSYTISPANLPNNGASQITGSITCNKYWAGAICIFDYGTGGFLQSNLVSGGPKHSFSYNPFTCHGLTIAISDSNGCN